MRFTLARRLWADHHAKIHGLVTLLLLANFVAGAVAGFTAHDTLVRAFGGHKDTPAAIKSHWLSVTPQPIGGGGAVDLSYLFGPVLSQGNTSACSSFSLTAILYALRIQRGEVPATYFSPWFNRWFVAGPDLEAYSTMDQAVTAAYTDGMVYHYRQEAPGQPSADALYHADARSAYYSVFSTGGSSAFDQIAYEVETGHPVWWLHAVYNGEWYLSPSNPYTDNLPDHKWGDHFEVIVGVQGDYLKVRRSWGQSYGSGRYYYVSRAGVNASTEEAAVVSIGPHVVWPATTQAQPTIPQAPTVIPQAPTVIPYAQPTATPTPRAHPTATPTPTARPVARPHGPYWHLKAAMYLRPTPAVDPTSRFLVRRGAQVKAWGSQGSRPWLHVTYKAHTGYLLKRNLR